MILGVTDLSSTEVVVTQHVRSHATLECGAGTQSCFG